jgi:hypothetical protein
MNKNCLCNADYFQERQVLDFFFLSIWRKNISSKALEIPNYSLVSCLSLCIQQTRHISTTWELVRNTEIQVLSQNLHLNDISK